MAIKKDTLDDLLAGRDPKAVFSKDGLFDELKKALAERGLNAELDDHLDNEAAEGSQNRRNGSSKKTVLTETAKIDIRIPRDREGTFDPKLIQATSGGFRLRRQDRVDVRARHDGTRDPGPSPGALRAGGVAGPDFDGHRRRARDRGRMAEPAAGNELSAGFLRRHQGQDGSATKAWSATRLSISRLASQPDGTKDILGLWIETTEGAKFWLKVMNELKARGVEDILIAVVDGLKGFPEAIEAVFPQAAVQTCIVHLIRNSLDFVSWKDRKPVVAELRKIYRAADAETGRKALEAFERRPVGRQIRGDRARSGGGNGSRSSRSSPSLRPCAIVYTTNAIEALNATLRRAVRARGHFPPTRPRPN